MRLAEALVERSDYQNKILELKRRLLNNVKVQEGEESAERPDVLLKELDNVLEQLEELVKRINKTNTYTKFDDNMSLADAIATKDKFKKKRNILVALIEEASIKHDRYSQSEVKFVTTVKISSIQKQIDDLAKEYRIIDIKIQEKNWTTELL